MVLAVQFGGQKLNSKNENGTRQQAFHHELFLASDPPMPQWGRHFLRRWLLFHLPCGP